MKTNHILLTAALLLSAASCTKEAAKFENYMADVVSRHVQRGD